MFYNAYEVLYKVSMSLLTEESVLITSQPVEEVNLSRRSNRADPTLLERSSYSGDDSYCFLKRNYNFVPLFAFKITRETCSLQTTQRLLNLMPVYEGSNLYICSYERNKDLIKFDGSYYNLCVFRQALLDLEDQPSSLTAFEKEWNDVMEEFEVEVDENEIPPFDEWKTLDSIKSYLNSLTPPSDIHNQVILSGLRIPFSSIAPVEIPSTPITDLYTKKLGELNSYLDTPIGQLTKKVLSNLKHTGYVEPNLPEACSFFKLGLLTESEYLEHSHDIDKLTSYCHQVIDSPDARFLLAYIHKPSSTYYHLTNKSSVQSILDNGFRLDINSFNDMGDGIYAIPSSNESGFLNLKNWLLDNIYSNNITNPYNTYALLEFSTTSEVLECIYDSSHKGYVLIPNPSAITDIHEIPLTNLISQEDFNLTSYQEIAHF